MRSWQPTALSLSPPGPRSASRSSRVGRVSRSSAFSTLAEVAAKQGLISPREQRPITAMRGVGAALAEKLERLGVTQVQDLLFVLPSRYEDRTRVWPMGSLMPGVRAAVEGEIQLTEVTYRKRRQLLCRISDGSGFLTLRFFHFSAAQQNGLPRGARIRCFG